MKLSVAPESSSAFTGNFFSVSRDSRVRSTLISLIMLRDLVWISPVDFSFSIYFIALLCCCSADFSFCGTKGYIFSIEVTWEDNDESSSTGSTLKQLFRICYDYSFSFGLIEYLFSFTLLFFSWLISFTQRFIIIMSFYCAFVITYSAYVIFVITTSYSSLLCHCFVITYLAYDDSSFSLSHINTCTS